MKDASIFIVDDDSGQRALLLRVLHKYGYNNVRVFSGAKEALEAAYAEPPQLFLLDVMMPEVDGYEASYRIRKSAELENTKVILLTALSTSIFVNLGRQAKADAYIVKPYAAAELIATIEKLLTTTKTTTNDNDIGAQSQTG